MITKGTMEVSSKTRTVPRIKAVCPKHEQYLVSRQYAYALPSLPWAFCILARSNQSRAVHLRVLPCPCSPQTLSPHGHKHTAAGATGYGDAGR